MKLIGRLKEDVENAAGKAEAMEIIRNAGMELTADELEMVTGGAGISPPMDNPLDRNSTKILAKIRCKECKTILTSNYAGLNCPICNKHTEYEILPYDTPANRRGITF